ncbi:MAG: hypothetical protein F6K00_33685 [Leptolyngbya sp. SIOISBB]|nr:hypothetical protein [Leptolyngbya sp. SIOISBB]
MPARDPNEFVSVNGALNLKPSFGPIPADQIIPWGVIALGNILVANRLLGLSWVITILSTGWGIGTWWILTGSDASRFLSKFRSPPVWLYGHLPYFSPLEPIPRNLENSKKGQKGKKHRKKRRRINS